MRNQRHVAVWGQSSANPYPYLKRDLRSDVIVVGAGVSGLTAALELADAGLDVALIEAHRIGAGATGSTTAKVTSLHRAIYSELLRADKERALAYASANQYGVQRIREIIASNSIDADWEPAAHLVYAVDEEGVERIDAEIDAATACGLPVTRRSGQIGLPFPVQSAAVLEDQGHLHPMRYLEGLASVLSARGVRIFENSRAVSLEDGELLVHTPEGDATATGRWLVMATHQPFPLTGAFFARGEMHASYAIAVRGAPRLQDMFISVTDPIRSLRPVRIDGEDLMIVGGEEHIVGRGDETDHHAILEDWARQTFGAEIEVAARWFASDYHANDGFPFVGSLSAGEENVLVATGYRKWGFTNATAAAAIIRDRILGTDNPWAEAFDTSRLSLREAIKGVTENASVAKEMLTGAVRAMSDLERLEPGQASVGTCDGQRVAAYRDDEGRLHKVSAACTHMGCMVAWNDSERTWDCPCHGSRFSHTGELLEGPATRDLTPIED